MNYYVIIIVVINIVKSKSEWILQWKDEFNDEILNASNWQVKNELISCDG